MNAKLPSTVQISLVTGYAGVLLNRDDNGLAKRLPLGGVTRVRTSSQCIKRHWRMAEGPRALSAIADTSVRSREIFKREIARPLVAEGFDPEAVTAVLLAFQDILYRKSEKADKQRKQRREEGGEQDVLAELDRKELVILGRPEIRWLTDKARDILQQAGDAKAAAAKADAFLKDNKANMQAMRNGAGLDVALFGRMVSGDMDARVDAAVHVAHAFTISRPQIEPDFFTAVDDLATGDEHGGTAHMNSAELTSGLFYHYAVIDVPLLVSNLEGCAEQDWLTADHTAARKVVENLIHLAATVSPGAKKGSTAPYATADLVFVEAGGGLPMTLANAFRTPCRDTIDDAQRAMADYLARKDKQLGVTRARRWLASIADGPAMPLTEEVSLPDLAAKAAEAAFCPEPMTEMGPA